MKVYGGLLVGALVAGGSAGLAGGATAALPAGDPGPAGQVVSGACVGGSELALRATAGESADRLNVSLTMTGRPATQDKDRISIAGLGAPSATWNLAVSVRRVGEKPFITTPTAAIADEDGSFRGASTFKLGDRATVTVSARRAGGLSQRVSLNRLW